jgi:hypothetical protein
MFVVDAAQLVRETAAGGVLAAVAAGAAAGAVVAQPDEPGELAAVVPISAGRPRRPSLVVTRVAAVVAAVPLLWAALTTGVGVATAYGAGVAHPRHNVGQVVYVGVRLSPAQLGDPVIAGRLASMHASAVVDELTAQDDPASVQHLTALGVDIANGGFGRRIDSRGHPVTAAPWHRATGDVRASHLLAQIAGQPVKVFVPGRRLNAFDLVASYGAHSRTVVPDHVIEAADADRTPHLVVRHTYLISGIDATQQQVEGRLAELATQMAAAGLSAAPLAELV